ncbi:hypothetical protein CDAR_569181 [Caerostris darwini]|uniref:Uncharacterized protein n=1 Tax=Caerostris darwini TaxID=1538125 RepID=A0AAV4Q8H4_9ARAC|nr:hypothetical protein CDAR_569181 [Caerostris darwini]
MAAALFQRDFPPSRIPTETPSALTVLLGIHLHGVGSLSPANSTSESRVICLHSFLLFHLSVPSWSTFESSLITVTPLIVDYYGDP